MSTIKVNTIDNNGSNVDFPNKLKVRGNAIEQGYTASGTEPSSPSEGDFWYDSTNSVLYQYINSEFKTVSLEALFNWGGDRAIISGGRNSSSTPLNNIEYYDITTTGNASDFGDLTTTRAICSSCSSTSRALVFNGYPASGSDHQSIDYFAIATTGNAADFGDSLHNAIKISCASDGTYGFHIGGQSIGTTNQIGRVTIGTLGNATDFGDLTTSSGDYIGSVYGATYVHCGGGDRSGYSNVIDFFASASAGNASDFGDLTSSREEFDACGDATRGVWCGGRTSGSSGGVNTMDYVTLGTAGNAVDFGDLTGSRKVHACTSNKTYGTINGGLNGSSLQNQIMYFTIQTTGNASDFGDLTQSNNYLAGCSGNAS